ncbi:hypothetical protein TRVL_07622 [Trypanosoma vivax]|nr:hypothetical protein TRVL_07622 [Trypanosoma vivax]
MKFAGALSHKARLRPSSIREKPPAGAALNQGERGTNTYEYEMGRDRRTAPLLAVTVCSLKMPLPSASATKRTERFKLVGRDCPGLSASSSKIAPGHCVGKRASVLATAGPC